MLIKKDSEFVHNLIRNYDYVVHRFWLLFWTTLQTNSQHFWKSIRVCEYNNQKFRSLCPQILTMVQKLWLCFGCYGNQLVNQTSTTFIPNSDQTSTPKCRSWVRPNFDHTSFKFWLYLQRIMPMFSKHSTIWLKGCVNQ